METIKMLAIILLLMIAPASAFRYSNDTDAVTVEATMCPPGYFMVPAQRDLPCRPCPADSFLDQYNRMSTCLPHRQCSRPNEVYLFKGSSVADSVCSCKLGTQRTYNISVGFHYECTPCPAGTHSVPVLPFSNAFEPGETKCCPPNHSAIKLLGQSICSPYIDFSTPLEETLVYPAHWHSTEAKLGDEYDDVLLDNTKISLLLAAIFVIVLVMSHQKHP